MNVVLFVLLAVSVQLTRGMEIPDKDEILDMMMTKHEQLQQDVLSMKSQVSQQQKEIRQLREQLDKVQKELGMVKTHRGQKTGRIVKDSSFPSGANPQAKGWSVQTVVAGPLNTADVVNETVTLTCEGSDSSWIWWWEYVTGDQTGTPISAGAYLDDHHVNYARYEIIWDGVNQYDLLIHDTVLTDGGTYRCMDYYATGSEAYAEVIMLASDPVCTTTMPSNGVLIDDTTYVIQCSVTYQGSVAPIMTWTGPAPYNVQSSTTNTTVSSNLTFTANKSMTGDQYSCKTNFTSSGFNQPNSATNAPDYEYVHEEEIAFVYPIIYVNYIRWGRTVCDGGATVAYTGWAAASATSQRYGGSDYLCLPTAMEWGSVVSGQQASGGFHYAVEYEIDPAGTPFSFANNGGISLQDYEAACVTCLTNRTSHLMIAGKTTCPTGWTMEYRGYLVSETSYRTGQVCLDEAPETVPGSASNNGWGTFSVIELTCGGGASPCTTWDELACVVCTY